MQPAEDILDSDSTRSRCEIRIGSGGHGPRHGDGIVAHVLSQSVAERCCRTVGGKLLPRIARSCPPGQPAPPAPTSYRVCPRFHQNYTHLELSQGTANERART